jgi:hypothetical protein
VTDLSAYFLQIAETTADSLKIEIISTEKLLTRYENRISSVLVTEGVFGQKSPLEMG